MYELFILGQLMDFPMTGYSLRKALTNVIGEELTISFGALYPLLDKLEKAGYIVLSFKEVNNKRPQKLATITDIGRVHFMELALEKVPLNKQTQLTYQMKINFLHLLTSAQQVNVLKDFQNFSREQLEHLTEMKHHLANNPNMVQADIDDSLLVNQLRTAKTQVQLEWVTKLLDKKKGE